MDEKRLNEAVEELKKAASKRAREIVEKYDEIMSSAKSANIDDTEVIIALISLLIETQEGTGPSLVTTLSIAAAADEIKKRAEA